MFAPYRTASSSYGTVDLETQVSQANPHRLVAMLYDGCMLSIARARLALERGDVAARGEATSKAIRIIDEGLKAALDHKAGASISANLASLYEYMTHTLLLANARGDDGRYAEVARLLDALREAWRQIGTQVPSTSAAPR